MLKIIFFILPIIVFDLYQIELDSYNPKLTYFLRPNQNEYIIIYSRLSLISYEEGSYLIRVDSKRDNMITHEQLFDGNFLSFINLRNNINIYFFSYYLIVEKNGKKNTLKFASYFGHKFSQRVYSINSILFGTYIYTTDENFNWGYRIQLILLKEPYIDFDRAIIIEELAQTDSFKLIGLKDYYIFIRIDRNYFEQAISYTYTYKILDLNLNLLKSTSITYANYSEIIFPDLSENKDVNEFLICIEYPNISTECQIIKYENSNLLFSEKYEIFSQKEKIDR